MKITKLTYLLPLLFIALLAACCNEDSTLTNGANGAEESGTGNVTFNISSSRGALLPAENDDELIKSYMIVVVKDGKIEKVLTSPASLHAAEMHSVKASLTSGTYTVYAFANIPFSAAGDFLYGKFTEGATMPDVSSMFYNVSTFVNGYTGAIPMSSKGEGLTLEVLPHKGSATYGIEVVRMLAKLEFVFSNSSSKPVEVSEIKMGQMTNGAIRLAWYDDKDALSFASDAKADYTYTITTPLALAAGATAEGPNNIVRFNVLEAMPDDVTKQFHLTFKVKYNGQTEERYALLDKSQVIIPDGTPGTNLDGDKDRSPFIRRNDWIHIPIDLGDYEVKLTARSYPPIGGYPEAEIETGNDGFVVKFKHQGDFVIVPSLRMFGSQDWIELDNTNVVENYTFSVDTDPEHGFANIFATNKTPKKKGREIVGAIKSGASGTALVTLTVNTKTTGGVARQIVRKMYITV